MARKTPADPATRQAQLDADSADLLRDRRIERQRIAGWFGANLRALRTRANLSQLALEKRAGLLRGQVSRIESGTEPAWSTAVVLARALGCPLDELTAEPE